mmetsp:Transcript_30684/g.71366  ORF Transcript_30684/g.71366 Transcript_30684/m.71366 type:complete len:231 (+) Transcript_30684:53-745(+)
MGRLPHSRAATLKKRTTYDPSFKLQVVREALLRPVHNRIKPTCARYPGIEPCQLRKWIRNLESEARATGDGSSAAARKRPRAVPLLPLAKESICGGRKGSGIRGGGGGVRRSSRPRKPSARAHPVGEEAGVDGAYDSDHDEDDDDEEGEDDEDEDDDADLDDDEAEERRGAVAAAALHTPVQMLFGGALHDDLVPLNGHQDCLIEDFCLPEPMMALKHAGQSLPVRWRRH